MSALLSLMTTDLEADVNLIKSTYDDFDAAQSESIGANFR